MLVVSAMLLKFLILFLVHIFVEGELPRYTGAVNVWLNVLHVLCSIATQ
jgi:hypothetical protein